MLSLEQDTARHAPPCLTTESCCQLRYKDGNLVRDDVHGTSFDRQLQPQNKWSRHMLCKAAIDLLPSPIARIAGQWRSCGS